jgi:MYXO-CTERM domain-containing protein
MDTAKLFSCGARLGCIGALGLVAMGCGPTVTVKDDVDIDWDFIELTGPSDEMHTPYVLGSSMNVYVESTDHNNKMNGWSVESSDPTVFSVQNPQYDSDHRLFVNGYTTGEGFADLTVRDSDHRAVAVHTVEVRLPDRAQIMAHGLLIIGQSETAAEVNEVRLLDGGTATFLVQYFKDNRTLYGNGALGVDAPADVVATTPRTYLFEARDWLQVTPSQVGTSSLSLKVNGNAFATVPLTVVDGSEVQTVHVAGADESHAQKGTWLVALGQALDSMSRQIYGVAFAWEVDGQSQTGWDGDTGDLYRYKFDPAQPKMLAAIYGGVSGVAKIHSSGGYVDSSNNLGCSAAPAAPSLPDWGLVLFALGMAVSRIRGRNGRFRR